MTAEACTIELTYKDYTGVYAYDPETSLFHGEVIGIRDVITFFADTPETAEQEFHQSIDDYLEFCQSKNQPPA